MPPIVWTAAVGLALVVPTNTPSAQQPYVHMNPAIEKLAAGKPMIGTQTADMSLQNCRALARLDYDYVYVDMEHGPLNLDALASCRAAMVDKAYALKTGSAREKVALFARFPPYGRDIESNDWIVKQALDMGLMGIIFRFFADLSTAPSRPSNHYCGTSPTVGTSAGARRKYEMMRFGRDV